MLINIVRHSYLMYNMYLFIVYTVIHCRCNHSIIETCTAVDGTLCVGRSRNVLMAAIGMAKEKRSSNTSKSREVAYMQCETASVNAGVAEILMHLQYNCIIMYYTYNLAGQARIDVARTVLALPLGVML